MANNNEPITICHTSDNHNLFGILKTIPDALPQADILIVSGDFTNDGKAKETEEFIREVQEIRNRYKHIIVIFGNHEHRPNISEAEKSRKLLQECDFITFVEDEMVQLCGLNIYCLGWDSYERQPLDRTPFENFLKKAETENIDILVTHEPPLGVLGGVSMALLKVLQVAKPRYHLFGHIHESYGSLEKSIQGTQIYFSNGASKNDQLHTARPARLIKITK